jgi:dethiobiotin synthetase
VVIVEGAGGLMSPIGETDYVADLAAEFGYPLIVVAPNRIGTINSTLITLIAAAARPKPLPIAGIVLNDVLPLESGDPSMHSNRMELELRCVPPVLAHLSHGAPLFDRSVDWLALAGVPA